MKKLITLTGMAILFSFASAQAVPILYDTDPADLFVGNPPKSGGYLYGKEVRPIADNKLSILLNGHNGTTLDDPLLLILGIPNTTALPALISSTVPASTPTGPAFKDKMTAGQEVYGVLGLGDGANNSNSFTNWAAADLDVNGITATYFGLFEYSLGGAGIISGDHTVEVDFLSALPQGTFAVAYGTTHRSANGEVRWTPFTTPFTESGLTTGGGAPPNEIVPEPATVALLGFGLVGLGLYRRTRRE